MPTVSFDLPAIKTSAFETIDGGENSGTLAAIDPKANGKIPWLQQTEDPLIGGVLATAGGLVSTREGKGDVSAFDANTGERQWGFNCGAGVNAAPLWGFPLGRTFRLETIAAHPSSNSLEHGK
jgi:alcohol dehydrogenase (cytochrome c)